ncbi:AbrB/MazE/SpoVT family DNA-binding domain-containing protein [Kyrpidia tusciae]|uniref:Transcriptional regulator, AbrB family n=1 Tax=Kyrpidia tusciae (strain DSM 2912 / NBRC 15312 / T2) TaxID=562970 RepID=D5WRS8_KYRT2|nr:AbrB/MazE/SpoVT family DNA-binding domain-containing protein [Kyrpidia tusciae]ADG06880.1 transcriptional regulator, AbrB family [Kyrpidia tusciae DSM 2912]
MPATRTMSTKGQVVIPIEVRRMLNIQPGDEVVFSVNESGEVIMTVKKKTKLADLIGILPPGNNNERDFDAVREKARRTMSVRKHTAKED